MENQAVVTGVIQNNTPEYLWDEVDNGIDLAWIEHLDNCTGEDHYRCGPMERGTTLIGAWIKDHGEYVPDIAGEYAAIVREFVTQVVWSRYTKSVRACSPCYPGQGDLDTPGDAMIAYDLPPDIYGKQ